MESAVASARVERPDTFNVAVLTFSVFEITRERSESRVDGPLTFKLVVLTLPVFVIALACRESFVIVVIFAARAEIESALSGPTSLNLLANSESVQIVSELWI